MTNLTYTISRLESSIDTLKNLMEYAKSKERDEVYAWEIANLQLVAEDLNKYVSNTRESKDTLITS